MSKYIILFKAVALIGKICETVALNLLLRNFSYKQLGQVPWRDQAVNQQVAMMPRMAFRGDVRHALFVLALVFIGLHYSPSNVSATTFCSTPTTADCLYEPPVLYNIPAINPQVTLSYVDETGHTRDIEVLIRVPINAPQPMPVAIWSHGGAQGKTNPSNSLPEWSEASARSGYLSISIAHPGRPNSCVVNPSLVCTMANPPGSREDLCNALGINVTECQEFKHLNWDRPFDILRVLVELESLAQSGAWAGLIDLERIAVGGHSAGSGGALSVAGAVRIHHDVTLDFPDYVANVYPGSIQYPRPIAYLAFSPQGPGSEGFFETDFNQPNTSWDPIDVPVLLGTGHGDNGCHSIYDCGSGDTPYARRAPFDLMSAPFKYRLYLRDSDSYHNLFALKESKCGPNQPVSQAKCDDFIDWLQSTGIAFLDAHVKGLQGAIDWLNADNITQAAELTQPGVMEWTVK